MIQKFNEVVYLIFTNLCQYDISRLTYTRQNSVPIKSDCVIIFLLKLKSWWEKGDVKYSQLTLK
ncbi:hypothetical protein FWK35_00026798 [Aphis craccivora]|uniref:Uncharacterized protein n=1 Tax=Aphis craccivora TaxID=307492 RepID=A0A6G0VWG2_APHCR|nr:hypothetical protein FWK35_00026798 [Aphis craccivora]